MLQPRWPDRSGTLTRMDESRLIELMLNGDENAYKQVVTAYYPSMYAFSRSIVGEAIADEVVQESWVSVIKALDKFEKRSSLKTWILRIVSNTAKNRLRKESRLISFEDLGSRESSEGTEDWFDLKGHWSATHVPHNWHHESPDDICASDQLRGKLEQALAALPPQQLAVITLRDMEGMSFEDVCKILEVSESNARVLLHRGRTRLRQVIAEYDNIHGEP